MTKNLKKIFFTLFTFMIFTPHVASACEIKEEYERKDPPFFRLITDNEREIYILGSPHTVPLGKLLSDSTIKELIRISGEKTILYTEHDTTNEVTFKYLQDPENRISEEIIKEHGNLINIIEDEEQKKDFIKIIGNKIYLNISDKSGFSYEQILNAKLWLAAPIFGAHSNILHYREFGGLETELQYHVDWKNRWGEVRYLESQEEAIQILKNNKNEDGNHSIKWFGNSILEILKFESMGKEIRNKLFAYDMKKSIENYSWEVIKYKYTEEIPISAIKRNKLWVNVILQKLKEEVKMPLLIVIGDGHLVGNESFLSLLNTSLKCEKVERFVQNVGWK